MWQINQPVGRANQHRGPHTFYQTMGICFSHPNTFGRVQKEKVERLNQSRVWQQLKCRNDSAGKQKHLHLQKKCFFIFRNADKE